MDRDPPKPVRPGASRWRWWKRGIIAALALAALAVGAMAIDVYAPHVAAWAILRFRAEPPPKIWNAELIGKTYSEIKSLLGEPRFVDPKGSLYWGQAHAWGKYDLQIGFISSDERQYRVADSTVADSVSVKAFVELAPDYVVVVRVDLRNGRHGMSG